VGDPQTVDQTVEHRARILPTYVGGFLMGSADIVPGVSGGTIALVLGIYETLVEQIQQVATALGQFLKGDFRDGVQALRDVRWVFLLPLGFGIITAVLLLAAALEHLLEVRPVQMSALFLGLVAGSVVIAAGMLKEPARHHLGIAIVTAIVTFLGLGLRSGRIEDPSYVVVFAAGAIAICAMILPGISGSFLLLIMGMYETVIGAVSDRNVLLAVVFLAGAVVGLSLFSTLLEWLLEHHHDRVLAALLGLMAGSLRVLWPWPAGEDGVGDTGLSAPVVADLPLTILLAVVGLVLVYGVAQVGRLVDDD
jgi:putative membrane protein